MKKHDPKKIDIARRMLQTKKGATVLEISKATGRGVRAVRRWMALFNKEGEIIRVGIPVRYRLVKP